MVGEWGEGQESTDRHVTVAATSTTRSRKKCSEKTKKQLSIYRNQRDASETSVQCERDKRERKRESALSRIDRRDHFMIFLNNKIAAGEVKCTHAPRTHIAARASSNPAREGAGWAGGRLAIPNEAIRTRPYTEFWPKYSA